MTRHARTLSAIMLPALALLLMAATPPKVAPPAAAPPAAAPAPAPAPELTARQILDRVDDLYRGESSHALMSMSVITKHWSRTLEMEMWSRGKKRSLARIRSPKKERGMATLRVDNDIWNYLPKVNRTIKVPSSMMGGSWMGSHFTNDDLVKESRMADDFTFKVTFRGKRAGKTIYEITCVPRKDAAVVWGKIVADVEKGSWLPTQMRYFDEDGKLARTMKFDRYMVAKGRKVPARMVIIPADRPRESTTVTYKKIEFDLKLPDSLFSKRSLRR